MRYAFSCRTTENRTKKMATKVEHRFWWWLVTMNLWPSGVVISYSQVFYSRASMCLCLRITCLSLIGFGRTCITLEFVFAQGRTRARNHAATTIVHHCLRNYTSVAHRISLSASTGHKGECWMLFMHCSLLPGLTFNLWFGKKCIFFRALMLLSMCVQWAASGSTKVGSIIHTIRMDRGVHFILFSFIDRRRFRLASFHFLHFALLAQTVAAAAAECV